jgi:hypothetical protein
MIISPDVNLNADHRLSGDLSKEPLNPKDVDVIIDRVRVVELLESEPCTPVTRAVCWR